MTDPKSLRPITLLRKSPGRNHVIKDLQSDPRGQVFSHFGFRKGKSTTYAINNLVRHIKVNSEHSLVIFIDISGVLDNLLWPKLLAALYHRIAADIIRIIKSYLSKKTVKYESNTREVSTRLTRVARRAMPWAHNYGIRF